jgi:hypothetical protein
MLRIGAPNLASRLETIGFSIDRFPDIVDFIPVKSLGASLEFALIK